MHLCHGKPVSAQGTLLDRWVSDVVLVLKFMEPERGDVVMAREPISGERIVTGRREEGEACGVV